MTCLLLCTGGTWCAVHCTQLQCITLCLPADLDQVQNQVLVEVLGLQELQQEVLRLQLQLQLQFEVLRCETPGVSNQINHHMETCIVRIQEGGEEVIYSRAYCDLPSDLMLTSALPVNWSVVDVAATVTHLTSSSSSSSVSATKSMCYFQQIM